MKKNKYFFLILALSVLACSRKSPHVLMSRWDSHKAVTSYVVERKLASAPHGQCLRDVFSVDTLKQEMKDLESKYAKGRAVSGRWRHLELNRLPVPQANFLKTYGSKIGDLKNPDSIDYSSCSDVPCIFNKIYDKEDDVAGYVHYIWYLRFGHMLSADNSVPMSFVNGKFPPENPGIYHGRPFPLSSYLYNRQELYGLWRVSLMLKAPFTTLKNLSETQRIPRGQLFEDPGENMDKACGLANSIGWIKLNDGCLSIWDSPDQGALYESVVHEFAHHIDFEEGKGSTEFYRSHRKDYLNLAGFSEEEYAEGTRIIKRWVQKPNSKNVSPYAGTFPHENFAETLAYFRTDGQKAIENVSSEQFSFTSTKYFSGQAFNNDSLFKDWLVKNKVDSDREIFKAVIDCHSNSGNFRSNYFTASDFSTPVLPAFLHCIGQRAAPVADSIRAKVLISEPESCNLLKDENEKKWKKELKKFLISSFDFYLKELSKDPEYLQRIQKFYAELSDPKLAREAYLDCYRDRDEAACFKKDIFIKALDNALLLNMTSEQTQEVALLYISQHPFEVTKNEVLQIYRTMVDSQKDQIKNAASSSWATCRDIPHNDTLPPTGNIFRVSNGYLVSSFYNCLNLNLPTNLRDVVRNITFEGAKTSHAKEELLLLSEVRPIFLNHLKDFHARDKEKESIQIRKYLENEGEGIRAKILSDLSWVKNVNSERILLSECKKQAMRIIDFNAIYHIKNEVFSSFVETSACQAINKTPQFEALVNKIREERSILNSVEEKIMAAGIERAKICIQKYPVDNVFNKIRYLRAREACLIDDWSILEEDVLSSMVDLPDVKRLRISKEMMRGRLQEQRRRIQAIVMREYF